VIKKHQLNTSIQSLSCKQMDYKYVQISLSFFVLIGATNADTSSDDAGYISNSDTWSDFVHDFPYPTCWKIVDITVSTFEAFSCICALFVMSFMLLSDETRKSGFNVYMIFLILPDALINGTFAIDLFIAAFFNKGFTTYIGCLARVEIAIFNSLVNMYLNAFVAYEVYSLAAGSSRGIRKNPPSLQKVYTQILFVYVLSALCATWNTLDVRWSPSGTHALEGCTWEYGSPEGGFFLASVALAVGFATVLLPTAFVIYFSYQIWKQKLLPISGRTRDVALYFMRILVIFFSFYFMKFTLLALIPPFVTPYSNLYFCLWKIQDITTVLQCLVTLYFAMTKVDIRNAVFELLSWFGITMVPLGGDVFPRRMQPRIVIFAQVESTDWDAADVYGNSVVENQINNSEDTNFVRASF